MIGIMRTYTQLTEEQRYQIYEDLTLGFTQKEISECLDVHKSTISREIRRNSRLKGYRPRQAQQLSEARKQNRSKERIQVKEWERVETIVKEDWSPEQISEWLAIYENIFISHEWIYLYIYQNKFDGGNLYRHLRCQKKRRKRYGEYSRRGQLKDRVSIDDGLICVDLKTRKGDWEADTVAGRQTGPRLVTLVERKTRFTLIGLASNKSAESVTKTIKEMLVGFEKFVHTITYDNGKEFAGHKEIGHTKFYPPKPISYQ